ncbi:MAG: hypothetical protein Tsb0021_02860 [Chlamydiales bacterium]
MSYIIDGYNLLFRLFQQQENLQEMRQELLDWLGNKLSQHDLESTIVFDAPFKPVVTIASYTGNLRVVYAEEHESADDFIVSELKYVRNPKLITVITSDKKLAWRVRRLNASTESVEAFTSKLKKKKQRKFPTSSQTIRKEFVRTPPSHKIDQAILSQEDEEFLKIFEQRYQVLYPKETLIQKKESAISEMEWWLKVFEERYQREFGESSK